MFLGVIFTTDVALERFINFVCLFGVFSDIFAIIEQFFAVLDETLEDSRRFCVVSQHVIPEAISFYGFTTHMAGGNTGFVHSYLVTA
jgi:hypothetical protein